MLHPTHKLESKPINLLLQEIKPDLERELMVRKLGWPSRACHKGTEAHDLFEETMETRA